MLFGQTHCFCPLELRSSGGDLHAWPKEVRDAAIITQLLLLFLLIRESNSAFCACQADTVPLTYITSPDWLIFKSLPTFWFDQGSSPPIRIQGRMVLTLTQLLLTCSFEVMLCGHPGHTGPQETDIFQNRTMGGSDSSSMRTSTPSTAAEPLLVHFFCTTPKEQSIVLRKWTMSQESRDRTTPPLMK